MLKALIKGALLACFLFALGLAQPVLADEGGTLTEQAGDALKDGEHLKAAKLAAQATKADAEDAEAWLYLGEATFELKDWSTSQKAYGEYLKLAPKAKNAPAVKAKLDKIAGEMAYVAKQNKEEEDQKAAAAAALAAEKAKQDEDKNAAADAKAEKMKKAAELKEQAKRLEAGEDVVETKTETKAAAKESAGPAVIHTRGFLVGYVMTGNWFDRLLEQVGSSPSDQIAQIPGGQVHTPNPKMRSNLPLQISYLHDGWVLGYQSYMLDALMDYSASGSSNTIGTGNLKADVNFFQVGYDWAFLSSRKGSPSDFQLYLPVRAEYGQALITLDKISTSVSAPGASLGIGSRWFPLPWLAGDLTATYHIPFGSKDINIGGPAGKESTVKVEMSDYEVRFGLAGFFF